MAAQRYGEESVALLRMQGSQWDLALALDNLGTVFATQGDQATARTLFEEEIALFHALNDKGGLAGAIVGLGYIAGQQGDYVTARAQFEMALALRRAEADKWMIAEALILLGEVLQRQGELEQASNLYGEGLVLVREVGDKAVMAHLLHQFGTLAQTQRKYERAACLFAVAAEMGNLSAGITFHTLVDLTDQEREIALLRTQLDEGAFAARWAEGQTMRVEQAIEYALAAPAAPGALSLLSGDDPVAPARPEGARTYPAGLTAREVEVLRLLAQGLTYAQIADKLVISRRTVNWHATSLYSKLGVTSRFAATRFASEHHLL